MFVALAAALTSLVFPGCTRRSAQTDGAPELTVRVLSGHPSVESNTLRIQVLHPTDPSMDVGTLTIRADMAHAGMKPLFAEASQVDQGIYEASLEWSMEGDWVISLEAALPDGRVLRRRLDVRVGSVPEPTSNALREKAAL